MLPFGVTIPATVPQGSEIPEELMNKPVCSQFMMHGQKNIKLFQKNAASSGCYEHKITILFVCNYHIIGKV